MARQYPAHALGMHILGGKFPLPSFFPTLALSTLSITHIASYEPPTHIQALILHPHLILSTVCSIFRLGFYLFICPFSAPTHPHSFLYYIINIWIYQIRKDPDTRLRVSMSLGHPQVKWPTDLSFWVAQVFADLGSTSVEVPRYPSYLSLNLVLKNLIRVRDI